MAANNMLATCVALFSVVVLGSEVYGNFQHQQLYLNNEIVIEGCNCVFPERFNTMVTMNGSRSFEACQIKSQDEILQVLNLHLSDELGATRIRFASICNASILGEKTFSNKEAVIHELEIENVNLSSASNILHSVKNLTKLRRLILVNNNLTEIPDNLLKNLNQLIEIVVAGNRLRRLIFLNTSDWKTNVEALTVWDNVKEISKEHLKDFANIKQLHLNNYAINILDNSGTFNQMKKLELLNLTRKINPPEKTRLPGGIFRENRNLKNLTLRRNSIEGVERETFVNLNHLETLDLSLNSLNASLMKYCFKKLASLNTLILENNNLQHLHREFFLGLDNLNTLRLSANKFKTVLDDEPFFYVSKAKTIDLSKSKIKNFTSNWFVNLQHLESLNLEFNSIHTLNCLDLVRLLSRNTSKILSVNLSGNDIIKVIFQSHTSASKVKGGKTTALEVRLDRSIFDTNECKKGRLSYLNVTANDNGLVLVLPEGNKAYSETSATCLCGENISPCSMEFNIANSNLIIDCKSKLKKEDSINPTLLGQMISSFLNNYTQYTVDIDFSYNSLGDDYIGKALERLYNIPITHLNVTSNELITTVLQINWTEKFPKLKTLDLRLNQIERIPFLNSILFENETELSIYLEGNPLLCDCNEIFRLLRWINSGNTKKNILDLNKLHCRFEKLRTFMTLELANLTYSEYKHLCDEHETTPKSMLAASIFGGIAIFASFVYAIFTNKRFRKVHYVSDDSSSENNRSSRLIYDAFVSYSHKDEDFVIKVIVPGLENPTDGSPKYRLCLHERDWVAGEWIPDQIAKSVATSRRTIIVLTKNFIESHWGTLEFRAAYEQVIQSKEKRLIVVIKDKLPDLNPIDRELRNFVTNNTYLQWGDPAFWKKLREALSSKTSW